MIVTAAKLAHLFHEGFVIEQARDGKGVRCDQEGDEIHHQNAGGIFGFDAFLRKSIDFKRLSAAGKRRDSVEKMLRRADDVDVLDLDLTVDQARQNHDRNRPQSEVKQKQGDGDQNILIPRRLDDVEDAGNIIEGKNDDPDQNRNG